MPPEIVGVVSNEEFVDEDDLLPSTDAAEPAAVFVQKVQTMRVTLPYHGHQRQTGSNGIQMVGTGWHLTMGNLSTS